MTGIVYYKQSIGPIVRTNKRSYFGVNLHLQPLFDVAVQVLDVCIIVEEVLKNRLELVHLFFGGHVI